jgi:hypothetical protein
VTNMSAGDSADRISARRNLRDDCAFSS